MSKSSPGQMVGLVLPNVAPPPTHERQQKSAAAGAATTLGHHAQR